MQRGASTWPRAGCSGHQWRPSTIIIACGDGNFYATHLRYSAYGGKTARASGSLVDNDCEPDCVGGTFHSYVGSVTLGDVATCDGRLYYDRIWWRFAGPHPFRDGNVLLAPEACPPPHIGAPPWQ